MAGLIAKLRFAAVSTGTSLKTVAQIAAPANQRLRVKEIAISFHGQVNTNEPITVEGFFQSTAGTMSAGTPTSTDQDTTETVQSTGQVNATVEPTAGNSAVGPWTIHPQTGVIYQVPKADEAMIKGGGRLGLCVTAPNSVLCDGYIKYEE